MTKSSTEQYSKIVFLEDSPIHMTGRTIEKPDYSKMYFIFNFTDGKQAKFRMDKDCHTMQQFLDRMNKVHELEEQLNTATRALKGISVWADTGNGGEQAVKNLCEKALKEMEGVK